MMLTSHLGGVNQDAKRQSYSQFGWIIRVGDISYPSTEDEKQIIVNSGRLAEQRSINLHWGY